MIISLVKVNYLFVLFTSITVLILGFLWYSPLLFGNIWIKLQEKRKEDIKASSLTFIIAPLTSLMSTWIIALLLTIPNELTIVSSLIISILVGLFTSIKIGMNHLFESRPFPYYLITIGYHLVSCVITGFIFGLIT